MFSNFYKRWKRILNRYQKRIGRLENSVMDDVHNFKEVFERNYVLEKEIAERTLELNQANKSILTLKHILSTMNSSEPLSEVLNTIANSLANDVGYVCCMIFQINQTGPFKGLKVRAITDNEYAKKINAILGTDVNSIEVCYDPKINPMAEAINSSTITNLKKFSILLDCSVKNIEEKRLKALDELLNKRSVSILPIKVQDDDFGCLVVVSVRSEITNTEKNFLSLLAGQMELAVTIANLFEQIREQAITDGLTGLYNRRHFDQCLLTEADRAARLNQPFSLISLDLDHLKFINDNYGHTAGDAAIKRIGEILKMNARSIDIPSRFGGEEFTIILPGIDTEGAMVAAERLRIAVESSQLPEIGTITTSVGVATFLRHTDSISELLELVDQALYKAKRNGRNQVQLASQKEEMNWQVTALLTFVDILTKQRVPINKELADELIEKLKKAPNDKQDLQDFLYYIVDALTYTFEPVYQRKDIQKKIDIAAEMAKRLNMARGERDCLKLAILLNDVGKIMVPEDILLKPGPLDDDEKRQIIKHPVIAAKEMLKPLKPSSCVVNIMESYKECWDGTGYPGELKGSQIPLASRIISIIDAYYAMTSDRPYRKAMSHDEAIQLLKEGANVKWDERLVNMFIEIVEKIKNSVITDKK